jgi:hypothetical protein
LIIDYDNNAHKGKKVKKTQGNVNRISDTVKREIPTSRAMRFTCYVKICTLYTPQRRRKKMQLLRDHVKETKAILKKKFRNIIKWSLKNTLEFFFLA